MNRTKIITIIFIIVYIGIGTTYSERSNYCEYKKLSANPEQNPEGTENAGSNIIGRSITTLFWPFFIAGDKINRVGIFDCKI